MNSGKSNIRAIDTSSVHRITSGQVVVDLATAVKELVENGLDAHATTIEVKFRNYGLDAIEVTDNGDGILKEDYSSIAIKHHTSKLRSFEDLTEVATYGFRGEAMSSLCALADVKIVTATKAEAPRATRLEMTVDGHIKTQTITPGQKGTCVTVENIFKTLPVRRKDLEKNHKRDFARALSYLQAYAIICTNVRLTVVNILPKSGKKSVMIASKGNSSVLDNIINIYGASAKDTIMPLNFGIKLHSQSLIKQLKPYDFAGKSREIELRIVGYISRPIFGQGRTASDRQHYFINARPCLLPQIARAVNETYKMFNSTQSPFVVCDLIMDTKNYDVNVSPDKRTILLHDENNLVVALKDELASVFDTCGHSVPRNNVTAPNQNLDPKALLQKLVTQSKLCFDYQEAESGIAELEEDAQNISTRNSIPSNSPREPISTKMNNSRVSSVLKENSRVLTDTDGTFQETNQLENDDSVVIKVGTNQITETLKRRKVLESSAETSKPVVSKNESLRNLTGTFTHLVPELANNEPFQMPRTPSDTIDVVDGMEVNAECTSANQIFIDNDHEVEMNNQEEEEKVEGEGGKAGETGQHDDVFMESPCSNGSRSCCSSDAETNESFSTQIHKTPSDSAVSFSGKRSSSSTKLRNYNLETRVHVSLDEIRSGYRQITDCQRNLMGVTESVKPKPTIGTLSKIAASDVGVDAALAEEFLTLTIQKEDFFKMKIIGQFNLGFIIVSRYKSSVGEGSRGSYELFIVDQHASDEKYNYERLKRETVIQNQPLVIPRTLNLTSLEELTIINNLLIFERNGFMIQIDEGLPPGQKCKLISLPISKGTSFDEKDLHELLYLIDEHPGQEYIKCSKVNAMFAMRACRSSIMIGKPLLQGTMEKVVNNLGTLDKPWNCPHGRPTMRHLMDMKIFGGTIPDLP
ncbi:DNA mismatch repair protein MutL [Nadsonia fulvescens var. elongata DSM 6958]|uniref:DNA mismatch repair protein PMS1 n=1 Tax=Nadsonia fulvescens var. elongata DSM 6958 TaxID=857566 RepID=A0A1E3PGR0_9ASCO|nr:DNA mismatch repair protein MutL [Nadsonia fulvescens var. elongata DSM 6958]